MHHAPAAAAAKAAAAAAADAAAVAAAGAAAAVADFTEAALTTKGDDSDIDFRDADLTDAEFLGAYVDASGTLYNDPTTA